MKCFDSWAALGSGSYAASDVESGGVHFLPVGAEKIGQRYVDDCIGGHRKGIYRRVLSVSDAYVDASSWNLLTNPEFSGATGTTPPTGWTATLGAGTNSFTLAARSDGIGNDLTMAKSHSAANQLIIYQDITSRISAGDLLVFGSEYETGAGSEGHYFQVILEFDISGNTIQYVIGKTNSLMPPPRFPPAGVRRFFEWYSSRNNGRDGCIVPSGFSTAIFKYTLQLGASGSCAVIVSRPHVYKIGNSL